MSTQDPAVVPHIHDAPAPSHFWRLNFWIKELPFSAVLILTLIGVAYTSFSKQPITGYWELLAPLIALVCVGTGWHSETDRAGRVRLIGTQILHWLAFLVVMNMLLLTERAAGLHLELDRTCHIHAAHSRHFHRGRARPVVASVLAWPHHGARYPGHRMGREFGFDLRADCRRVAWNSDCAVVAYSRVARPQGVKGGSPRSAGFETNPPKQ